METAALKTTAQSRENWLSNREGKIGGSTIAAILGLDDHRTPVDVWVNLTQKSSEVKTDSKPAIRGQMMEQTVANFFEMETGLRVIKNSAEQEMYIHPAYPYMVASPDRRYWTQDGTKGVLECKTTRFKVDDIPEKWFVQLMWYMGFLRYELGTIGWFEFPTEDFRHQQFTYNREFFEYLISEAVNFWDRYVKTDTPPPIMRATDVDKLFKKHVVGKTVYLPDEKIPTHYVRYNELNLVIKKLEEERDGIKDELKILCQDAEAIENDGKILFTYKADRDSLRFNTESFAADHPDLYAKYMRPTPGPRKFTIQK